MITPGSRAGLIRHIAGFLVSGIAALATDIGVTKVLGDVVGWPWALSRLAGISVAMIVAWLCHRRLTFAVQVPPSVSEFLRYAASAWSAAGLNYLVFLAVLWVRPSTDPTLAIALSSLVAMAYSYIAMRVAVFRRH